MIYFDNAATSWPKPEAVYLAVEKTMREVGGSPGRAGHRMALEAGRIITETRVLLARLFNIPDPNRIVFTLNTTDSSNLALKGYLKEGDHVITSAMEHNSIARPLEALRGQGVEITKIAGSMNAGIQPEAVKEAIRKNTRMIAITHASNVTGTINPIGEIGRVAHENKIILLVDAAQTAGAIPIDVRAMNIDLLAFPGHKGLLGPQGVGGLYIGKGIDLMPQKEGGTGIQSESPHQPDKLPERYESGTANTPGIAGLAEGVKYILQEGLNKIQAKEDFLIKRLYNGLQKIPGVVVYGPAAGEKRAAIVSFNIKDMEPAEVANILEQSFDIACRAGLHCSPEVYRSMGILDRGSVRLSPGYFNTEEEIELCINAVETIAQEE